MHILEKNLLQVVLSMCCVFSVAAQDALEIVKKADEKMRGKTSQAEMIIKTTRPTWTREMSMRAWMKGNNYSMILVLSPAKVATTSYANTME